MCVGNQQGAGQERRLKQLPGKPGTRGQERVSCAAGGGTRELGVVHAVVGP